ncbi:helix-turn-helix domain-containing protein [Zavarzinia aquatilis]|nr:helix-turn-helix transcriptional regulator [Zavarzinia aquatilis]
MSAARALFAVVTALHKARLEKGLTLEAVASRVGVTAQALDQWERRQVMPKLENFFGWARALGMTFKVTSGDEK